MTVFLLSVLFLSVVCGCLHTEAFTKPLVNLKCETGSAISDHVVNVTWQPTKDQSPDDVSFHLQNCHASIDCSIGYRRYVCFANNVYIA